MAREQLEKCRVMGLWLDWTLLGCVTLGKSLGVSEPWCFLGASMEMVHIYIQLMVRGDLGEAAARGQHYI